MSKNEPRTGVWIVKECSGRPVALWTALYVVDSAAKEDDGLGGEKCIEREARRRVVIRHVPDSVPILLPKKHSSWLRWQTLRKFEAENHLTCKPIPLTDLNSKAKGMFGFRSAWNELNFEQCLEILAWIGKEANFEYQFRFARTGGPAAYNASA